MVIDRPIYTEQLLLRPHGQRPMRNIWSRGLSQRRPSDAEGRAAGAAGTRAELAHFLAAASRSPKRATSNVGLEWGESESEAGAGHQATAAGNYMGMGLRSGMCGQMQQAHQRRQG